jgi:hypothetical protein
MLHDLLGYQRSSTLFNLSVHHSSVDRLPALLFVASNSSLFFVHSRLPISLLLQSVQKPLIFVARAPSLALTATGLPKILAIHGQ